MSTSDMSGGFPPSLRLFGAIFNLICCHLLKQNDRIIVWLIDLFYLN